MGRSTIDGRLEDAFEKVRSSRGMNVSPDGNRTQATCTGQLGWALWENRGERVSDCESTYVKLKDLQSKSIGDGQLPSFGFAASIAKVGVQVHKLLPEAADDR